MGAESLCPSYSNGIITSSVRLGIALRYFAIGLPYNIMVKFGVSHSFVFESVWIIVEAVVSRQCNVGNEISISIRC